MAWHGHAISLPGPLQHAPPCQLTPSQPPEHARHGRRRCGALDTPERNAPRRASDVHTHASARTATATDTPRARLASLACVTSSSSLCATSSATSPGTTQTSPLARGNDVADDLVDVLRRGYCELVSLSRPRLCMVFTTIKRIMTAVTSPTHARHRQSLSAPVDASSTMTSPPCLGLTSPV
jgi:hypothetical protein